MVLNRLNAFILFWALAIVGCGNPADETGYPSPYTGTTGYFDQKDGVPYVANGDSRMEKALLDWNAEHSVTPTTPQVKVVPTTPSTTSALPAITTVTPPVEKLTLAQRFKEFGISRYANPSPTTLPSRFGKVRYILSIVFEDGKQSDFEGNFTATGSHLTFYAISNDKKYSVSGSFDDSEPSETYGDLQINEFRTKEISRVLYHALLQPLVVHVNQTQVVVPGSYIDNEINRFKNTWGWTNNWAAVNGTAMFTTDVVKFSTGPNDVDLPPTILGFKGPSKRTGDQDQPISTITSGAAKDLSLIGNSEVNLQRLVSYPIIDPKTKEEQDLILELQPNPDPGQNVASTYTFDPSFGDAPPADPDQGGGNADNSAPPTNSVTAPPVADQAPPALPFTNNYYFKINNNLRRTKHMSEDWESNRGLSTVKAWMEIYKSKAKHGRFGQLQAFYKYANPFRPMVEAISNAYDVSPAFAYVTVIESLYFTGGNYEIQGNTESSAMGPFQILSGTAFGKKDGKTVGLNMRYNDPKTDANEDERRYFAPAACGAARYVRDLVDQFWKNDTTIAVLGYYQGPGGGNRAMACALTKKDSDCTGNNWNRYKNLIQGYNFKFETIDNTSAVPSDQREYVERKLAVYFISQDIGAEGFDLGQISDATWAKGIPTIQPPVQIKDNTCRAAVGRMRLTP